MASDHDEWLKERADELVQKTHARIGTWIEQRKAIIDFAREYAALASNTGEAEPTLLQDLHNELHLAQRTESVDVLLKSIGKARLLLARYRDSLAAPGAAIAAREVDEATAMKGGRWVSADDIEHMTGELLSLVTGDPYTPTKMVDAFQTLRAALASCQEAPVTPSAATPAAPGEVTLNKKDLNKLLNDFARACAFGDDLLARMATSKAIHEYLDAAFAALSHPAPVAAPAMHQATADLVRRFSDALAAKLAAAEKKYGYSDGWLSPDWMDECRAKLLEHIDKGDPRDVAAYCAFLWHHGESTAAPAANDQPIERRTNSRPFDSALNPLNEAPKRSELLGNEWSEISTLPQYDDLIWLYDQNSDTIEGPRVARVNDVDYYTHWASCEAPDTRVIDGETIAAPAPTSEAVAGAPFGIIDPDYARIFTKARVLAWQYGFALVMHGSFTRDLDLLLVPWEQRAFNGAAEHVITRLAAQCDLKIYKSTPSDKPHGRKCWTLHLPGFGDPRWVDLSVMPTLPTPGDSADAPVQQAAMGIEEERAAFESTMAKRSPGCDFHRFNKDNYSNRFTHNAWDGWLARAALKGEQPVEPSGGERGEAQ